MDIQYNEAELAFRDEVRALKVLPGERGWCDFDGSCDGCCWRVRELTTYTIRLYELLV